MDLEANQAQLVKLEGGATPAYRLLMLQLAAVGDIDRRMEIQSWTNGACTEERALLATRSHSHGGLR